LVFAIPFVVFSIPGGFFADRFSKRSVTVWTKGLELLTMALVTYAFWVNRLDLAAVALFLVCTQEAIFGPSKYGLLPALLPTSKLGGDMVFSEFGPFFAPMGATLPGVFLAPLLRARQNWPALFFSPPGLVVFPPTRGTPRPPAAARPRRFDWNWLK